MERNNQNESKPAVVIVVVVVMCVATVFAIFFFLQSGQNNEDTIEVTDTQEFEYTTFIQESETEIDPVRVEDEDFNEREDPVPDVLEENEVSERSPSAVISEMIEQAEKESRNRAYVAAFKAEVRSGQAQLVSECEFEEPLTSPDFERNTVWSEFVDAPSCGRAGAGTFSIRAEPRNDADCRALVSHTGVVYEGDECYRE